MIKQVIVLRTDLKNKDGHKVRTGKLIAQACHASIGFLVKPSDSVQILSEWASTGMTKICLKVNSENELLELYREAQKEHLPVYLVKDEGRTEFSEPTYTCLAIGPWDSEKIDKVTNGLSLL